MVGKERLVDGRLRLVGEGRLMDGTGRLVAWR